jgi:hypothetical protein
MTEWLMNLEQLMEWELAGENEVHVDYLPQYHFVHKIAHMIWPGIEPL